MTQPRIVIVADVLALAEEGARHFAGIAAEAVRTQGQFTVALAGGSTPAGLYRRLAQEPYASDVNWSRSFIYFGDERCVSPDHPDSNYRAAREALLDHIPVPPSNVFRMPGEMPDEDGALTYQMTLRQNFGLRGGSRPRMDLILLGVGEDGHTASLFPHGSALGERRRLVTVADAPPHARPSVRRLTLTLPVLNAAANVIFLVAGASKAVAVATSLGASELEHPVPARQVHLRKGATTWLIDRAAAAGLPTA